MIYIFVRRAEVIVVLQVVVLKSFTIVLQSETTKLMFSQFSKWNVLKMEATQSDPIIKFSRPSLRTLKSLCIIQGSLSNYITLIQ